MRPVGADSVPVPGVRVVLHRVAQDTQGPLDSVLAGPDGGFRFTLRPDTAAIHLLSARYAGIEYFTTPVDDRLTGGGRPVTLVVHDTSSRAPVELAARHIVIPRPGEDGTREVLDLVLLRNAGVVTRVAPDSQGASWLVPLPPASKGLDLGESDVSPDAVVRRGDTAVVSAPISPGEKRIALQYHLPSGGRTIEVPLGGSAVAANVLLEEPGATASAAGLALADSQMIEGRVFRRWTGELPAGATVRITLPGIPGDSRPLLIAMVGVLGLALAVAAWRALPRAPLVSVDRLVGELASLDARFEGKQTETAADEWSRYRARRDRLKAELEAALARESGGR